MKTVAPFCSEKVKNQVKKLNISKNILMNLRINKIRMNHNSGRYKMNVPMPIEKVISRKIKIQKCL